MAMESIEFPRDKDKYVLLDAVAKSQTATIYKAKAQITDPTTGNIEEIPVVIKIINNVRKFNDLYSLLNECHEARTCHGENLGKVYAYFKNGDEFWIVMPVLSMLSLRSVIRSVFHNGLPENMASFILNETLKALNNMHEKNKLHENMGANCIFMDVNSSTIKLVHRSLKYEIYDSEPEYPMPPELENNLKQGRSKATDVWMFGILALELFYGWIPDNDTNEFKVLVDRIRKSFGRSRRNGGVVKRVSVRTGMGGFLSCFSSKERRIPKALGEVLASCLCEDPSKRRTTSQLMDLDFFKRCNERSIKSLTKLNKAFKN